MGFAWICGRSPSRAFALVGTYGKEVQTRADPQDGDLPKIHAQPMEGELAVYSSLQITELMLGFGSVRRACRNAFCLQSCCDGRGTGHIRDSCSEDGIAYPASLCTRTTSSPRPTYTPH